ncbi:MAG: hypothetical protein ABSE73_19540 [Planctomycetota bacterium]
MEAGTVDTSLQLVEAELGPDETQITTMNAEEIAASLRVLVYFAKADGVLSPEEKEVLEEAFQELALPAGPPLKSLLDARIALQAELQKITSRAARERTYNAAYCLAYAEGPCPPERQKLLDEIRRGLGIPLERATLLGRMYAEARDWIIPGNINPIADTTQREAAIQEYISKFSIVNALSGAVPIPGFTILTDLLIVAVQVKMVRDIGQYWGHKVDKEAARSLIASTLGATSMRIAVHSLLNVIPVLGSAVGAASAFVTTWAVGKVANQYFASGGKLATQDLHNLYLEAKQDAKAACEKSKHVFSKRNGRSLDGGTDITR